MHLFDHSSEKSVAQQLNHHFFRLLYCGKNTIYMQDFHWGLSRTISWRSLKLGQYIWSTFGRVHPKMAALDYFCKQDKEFPFEFLQCGNILAKKHDRSTLKEKKMVYLQGQFEKLRIAVFLLLSVEKGNVSFYIWHRSEESRRFRSDGSDRMTHRMWNNTNETLIAELRKCFNPRETTSGSKLALFSLLVSVLGTTRRLWHSWAFAFPLYLKALPSLPYILPSVTHVFPSSPWLHFRELMSAHTSP